MNCIHILSGLAVLLLLGCFVSLAADECKLLLTIPYHGLTLCDNIEEEVLAEFKTHCGSDHIDGWGIAYYERLAQATGTCTLWRPDQPATTGYRYADHSIATSSSGHWTVMSDDLELIDNHIIIGHHRKASENTPGGDEMADPHPFLYRTNTNTFAFAHNGGVLPGTLTTMQTAIDDLMDLHQWSDLQLTALRHHSVDSGVYFGYLMAYIIHNDYDVLRGLHEALEAVNANDWNKNFVFTDGWDAYGYKNEIDDDHPLHYKCYHNTETDRYAHVVMTLNTQYSNTSFDDDELIYFSRDNLPIHFKNFSTDQPYLVKDLRGPTPQSENFYCWESFPVLHPDADAIETMEQQTTAYGSGNGFDTADQVTALNGDIIEKSGGNWQFGTLESFDQTFGYKVRCTTYDPDQAEVLGSIAAGNETYTLQNNGQSNWIGYWLLSSQSLRDALGDAFGDVAIVQGEDWCYKAPTGRQPDPGLDYAATPLVFGKMYNIVLKNTVEEPITFTWSNSHIPSTFVGMSEPEFFTPVNAAEYEVIDVASVENGEDIQEIGVFADDTCVGAAVVDDYPVQILTYTEGYEGVELEFQYYTGERAAVQANASIGVWDENDGEFYAASLTAGSIGYQTVTLGGKLKPMPQPVAPLAISASPNPFNPETTIALSLPTDGELEATIYNLRGQKVRTIATGHYAQGDYRFVWKGCDDNGAATASGVYFLRVNCAGQTATQKLLLLK